MIENRSVPPDTVLPHIRYQDIAEAIAWLANAFGLAEHYRYGDNAESISAARKCTSATPGLCLKGRDLAVPAPPFSATERRASSLFLENIDEHFRKAKSAGARILEDPRETIYGEFQYAAEDLAGHH